MSWSTPGRELFRPSKANAAAILVLGAMSAPFVVMIWIWMHRGAVSTGDVALIELRIRDLLSDPPMLGAYSRFGYQHPGPAMFYLLWIPYQVFGASGQALIVAMLVWGWLLTGVLAVEFLRHVGIGAAIGVVVATNSLVLAVGWKHVAWGWNPYFGTIAGMCLIGFLWLSFRHSRLCAVLVPVVASSMAQAHVGATLLAVAVCAMWLAVPGVEALGSDRPAQNLWRARSIGGALAALMWVPPLLDQWFGSGNLAALLDIAGGSDAGDRLSATDAFRATTMSLAVKPWWVDGAGPNSLIFLEVAPEFPVLLVGMVGLVLFAARRLRRSEATQVAIVCGGSVAAILGSFATIQGIPVTYLVAWVPGVVIACCALAAAIAVSASSTRVRSAITVVTAVVLCAQVGLVCIRAVQTPDAGPPSALRDDPRIDLPAGRAAERLWNQLRHRANANDSVMLDASASLGDAEVLAALAVVADRDGQTLLLRPTFEDAVSSRRIGGSADREWRIATDGLALRWLRESPAKVIALDNPLTEVETVEAELRFAAIDAARANNDPIAALDIESDLRKRFDGRSITVVLDTTP